MSVNNRNEESWGRFDFLGPAKYISAVSVALTLIGLVIILTRGLNYGVDFAGGIEIQVQFNKAIPAARVRGFMTEHGFPRANVQALGDGQEYLIHVELVEGKTDAETNEYIQATVHKLREGLATTFADAAPDVRRVDTVGPQIGKELRRNGALAAFYCLLLILVYIGLRFDYRYAPGAVFCLLHDALLTMAIYSILDWEFTVQTMAAVLTIIGYSLNDTIVIFDRIRENQVTWRNKDLYWISNRSINETLSRTVLTYLTTSIVVVCMYIFADGVIQDFARTMMIGMALGVFSTVYVATPLMLLMDAYQKRRKQVLQAA
ncbi:MAG: protein translocase subunit SecF [Bdellovibrionales bacterium]